MSWLYSRVLAEEYSEGISLDGAQCALWNGTPTQLPSWCNDRTISNCQLSQSGMTFKPLTASHGEDVLMSYLEAFPAKTSVAPAKVQASKESDLPCGRTWRESLEKFDLNTHTWKTHQCLWDEDLQPSSVILPKWGMMQNGELWERITSALPTSATESGLLPTPRATDGDKGSRTKTGAEKEYARGKNKDLGMFVAMWPTPRAQEAKHGKPTDWEMQTDHEGTKHSLRVQVAKRDKNWPTPTANEDAAGTPDGKMQWMFSHAARSGYCTRLEYQKQKWPTPTSSEYKGAVMDRIPGTDQYRGNLCEKAELETGAPQLENGKVMRLNPDWVEWLMGWPVGWTSMEKITELDWRDWSVDPANTGSVPRVTGGTKHRVGRLKAIGNGQCPQAAALAWTILTEGKSIEL
jgi:hypothetical protein